MPQPLSSLRASRLGPVRGGARQNSLNLRGEKRAAERSGRRLAGMGISDGRRGAAGEMGQGNGSAGKPQPRLRCKPGGEAGARRRSGHPSDSSQSCNVPKKNPQRLRLLFTSCSGDSALPKALKALAGFPQTEPAASPSTKQPDFGANGDGADPARPGLAPSSPGTGEGSPTALHRQPETEIWATLTAAQGPDYWSFTCKHKT